MNIYIKQQCENAKLYLQNFIKACELAALNDDGKISKEEEKMIKQIKASTIKYQSEIAKITEK